MKMFNDERNDGTCGESGLAKTFDASARRVLAVDVKKYEALLDDPNLSEAQKEEFLRALWSVVVTFVELGFGVHPLQEVCGQDSGDSFPGAKDAFDQVKSNVLVETQDGRDSGPTAGLKDHGYT
ncbi:hypothetical protein VB618_05695 [Microvirga sp. CF3062]|uniref:hypothetical protein n=1 Tax=Microvirga sp. CF3062 TaxID=3110182 RepID=UPI002E78E9C3|nr:hypothetical protein [Microvirga sp. CF3062]MEE1655682.1 hypothetical protein [Microvirga sp. CF3062]